MDSCHSFDADVEYQKVENTLIEQYEKLTPEEREKKYLTYKTEGNDYVKEKKFQEAIYKYSCALIFQPNDAILFSNRAHCRIKLEEYGSALVDAQSAITANSTYKKGYYRLGVASMALLKFKDAMNAFSKIKHLDSTSAKHFALCKKAYQEEVFAAAIASDVSSKELEKLRFPEHLMIKSFGKEVALNQEYDINNPLDKYTPELFKFIVENLENQTLSNIPLLLIQSILSDSHKVLRELPNVVHIPIEEGSHLRVLGDTHGQFFDVLNIFKDNGWPSEVPYLANGDFVDRGSTGYELTIMFLLLKLMYPNNMHLNRGNHEAISMNNIYGFKGEVLAKANLATFNMFTDVFNALPVSFNVQNMVFVTHGGLGANSSNMTIEDINKLNRFTQPPNSGIMCDLLWSDPTEGPTRKSYRGCSHLFDREVTERFVKTNGFKFIIRSHEFKQQGYEITHHTPGSEMCVITVFSAPNYCDESNNMGALVKLDHECNFEIIQFSQIKHKNHIPAMKFANQMMVY